jgi:hypothetical protein
MTSAVFSICISKARLIDSAEVKKIWQTRFPDDTVDRVDVVLYNPRNENAGYCKIFIHWHPQSDTAVKMRTFLHDDNRSIWMVDGPMWLTGLEKWCCSVSRIPMLDHQVNEASDIAIGLAVECIEPYLARGVLMESNILTSEIVKWMYLLVWFIILLVIGRYTILFWMQIILLWCDLLRINLT